jgi:hypothetical protein
LDLAFQGLFRVLSVFDGGFWGWRVEVNGPTPASVDEAEVF